MGYEEGSQFLIFFQIIIIIFFYGCKIILTLAAVSFIQHRFSI